MSKKKNLPAVVRAGDAEGQEIATAALRPRNDNEETLFFAALNARAEANRRGAELAQTQLALVHSEMLRAEEKRTARREMDGLVGFVSVGVLLVVAAVCALAAPVWTAALPLALMVAVMRKAGWM